MKIENRALRKTLSILANAFAAAVGTAAALEWSGYKGFDQANGDNLLCRADPYCRTLTPGEVALAREVFGKTVDPRNVKMFNRSHMLVFGRGGAISPNGNIYIDEKEAVADYSASPYLRTLFVHEMTHVWQHQRGRNLRTEAFQQWWKSDFKYQAIYDFNIDAHPRFRDYNLEQQAEIMGSYYSARASFRDGTVNINMACPSVQGPYFYSWAETSCAALKKLEDKISQVLPVTPQTGCEAFRPAPKPPSPAS